MSQRLNIAQLLVYLRDQELGDLVRDALAYQESCAGRFVKADLGPLRQIFADFPDTVSDAQFLIRRLLVRYPLLRSQSKETLINRLVALGEVWRSQLGGLLHLQQLELIAQTLQKYDVEGLLALGREPIPCEAKVFTDADLKELIAKTLAEAKQAKKAKKAKPCSESESESEEVKEITPRKRRT
jgi:hypothetical protein